jgi:hypothetical protein
MESRLDTTKASLGSLVSCLTEILDLLDTEGRIAIVNPHIDKMLEANRSEKYLECVEYPRSLSDVDLLDVAKECDALCRDLQEVRDVVWKEMHHRSDVRRGRARL